MTPPEDLFAEDPVQTLAWRPSGEGGNVRPPRSPGGVSMRSCHERPRRGSQIISSMQTRSRLRHGVGGSSGPENRRKCVAPAGEFVALEGRQSFLVALMSAAFNSWAE
jgi:hypothetical protein